MPFKIKFIYLLLPSLGLCCCAWAFYRCGKWGYSHWSVQASHCSGFSCCRAPALDALASVVAAYMFSTCGTWALEHEGFSSCDAKTELSHSTWNLPRRIKLMWPALASGFLTTGPPEKSKIMSFLKKESLLPRFIKFLQCKRPSCFSDLSADFGKHFH